jgi:hypothetical protein
MVGKLRSRIIAEEQQYLSTRIGRKYGNKRTRSRTSVSYSGSLCYEVH